MTTFIFALEFESARFRSRPAKMSFAPAIHHVGAGRERARAAVGKILETGRPDILISAGFAGALTPGLRVGDVFWAENFSDPALLDQIPVSWPRKRLVTAQQVIATQEEKKRLAAQTGADAVDMESEEIAVLCRARGVPMLGIRCISDALEDDMPVPPDRMLDAATGLPSPVRIVWHLVTHPLVIPAFVRFVGNSGRAQAKLAEALAEILPHIENSKIL